MSKEPVAKSLAQLHAQRKGSAQARRAEPRPVVDDVGQFGFSFEAPATAVVAIVESVVVESAGSELAGPAGPLTMLPVRGRNDAPWTVSELVSTLRGTLENQGAVWIVGEICNLRPAASGHLYFTLKDGAAQLGVVMFRRQAMALPWRPADGAAVLLRGRLSVFEGRGQLQLIAETLEPRGAGALQLQFERLKAKLRDEGLFETSRKRALPAFPQRVGVVTSLHGAVIRDIVSVCRRRSGCVDLLVYPAAVQGAGAAAEIAAGVRYLNRAAERSGPQAVDVIVLARGGGSAEDLAAFNDEALARVIAASSVPVVSAVGHETDFTIADFVADLRAPTPSAAAEILTESQHRVEERVQTLYARLFRAVRFQQMGARQRFTRVGAEAVLRRTADAVGLRQQRVDLLQERMERALFERRRLAGERVMRLETRLQRQDVRQQLRHTSVALQAVQARLLRAGAALAAAPSTHLAQLGGRLNALSPLAVLERGYALAFTEGGQLVRSSDQLQPGQTIRARFARGSALAQVTAVLDDAENSGNADDDGLRHAKGLATGPAAAASEA